MVQIEASACGGEGRGGFLMEVEQSLAAGGASIAQAEGVVGALLLMLEVEQLLGRGQQRRVQRLHAHGGGGARRPLREESSSRLLLVMLKLSSCIVESLLVARDQSLVAGVLGRVRIFVQLPAEWGVENSRSRASRGHSGGSSTELRPSELV